MLKGLVWLILLAAFIYLWSLQNAKFNWDKRLKLLRAKVEKCDDEFQKCTLSEVDMVIKEWESIGGDKKLGILTRSALRAQIAKKSPTPSDDVVEKILTQVLGTNTSLSFDAFVARKLVCEKCSSPL